MASREDEDAERCWVCLEGEAGGPLVQLCACRGSAKWSHRHCLDRWRRTSPKQTQPTAVASAWTSTATR